MKQCSPTDINHVLIWQGSNNSQLTVVAYQKDYSSGFLRLFAFYYDYTSRRDHTEYRYFNIAFDKEYSGFKSLAGTYDFPPTEYINNDNDDILEVSESDRLRFIQLDEYVKSHPISLIADTTVGEVISVGEMINHCEQGGEVGKGKERGISRFGGYAIDMSLDVDPLLVLLISQECGGECLMSPRAVLCTFDKNGPRDDSDLLLKQIRQVESIELIDIEQLTKHDPSKLGNDVPNDPGIFIWWDRLSGKPLLIGTTLAKGGIRNLLVNRDLNEKYIETFRVNVAKARKILPGSIRSIAAEKSSFRKLICREYPVWPGKMCVDFIKDTFLVSWYPLPDVTRDDAAEYERKLIKAHRPRFNKPSMI